ncbi:hypothetical protein N617_gp12 [Stygiolobus rod-shaped virus]|uniref:Uncharacterized protein n=1 Tax=Stygiolobus rod-shaped virus TaxID=537009 RepID=B6EFB8_9VIRU|nr:hypothetical protein N617_gp12 [Stygiolobus rod-shaped virus]CAQ58453.1 hypothetical protein [Stygiolobus rod-shaped virus]
MIELTPRQLEILNYVKKNQPIEIKDIALHFKIHYKTAKSYIVTLKRFGFLEIDQDGQVFTKNVDTRCEYIIAELKKQIEKLQDENTALKKKFHVV